MHHGRSQRSGHAPRPERTDDSGHPSQSISVVI
jgi:hypothetical protein